MANYDKLDELEIVAELGHWDWEWWTVAAFYDRDHNAYRVGSDSGCSCYMAWEGTDVRGELPPLGLKAAIVEFRRLSRERLPLTSFDKIEYEIRLLREHAEQYQARV